MTEKYARFRLYGLNVIMIIRAVWFFTFFSQLFWFLWVTAYGLYGCKTTLLASISIWSCTDTILEIPLHTIQNYSSVGAFTCTRCACAEAATAAATAAVRHRRLRDRHRRRRRCAVCVNARVAGFHVRPLQHRLSVRLRRLSYDMLAGGRPVVVSAAMSTTGYGR